MFRRAGSLRTGLTRILIVALAVSALSLSTAAAHAQHMGPTVTLVPNDTYGMVLTGTNGWTLYTWDGDVEGMSNCTGPCADAWPPYIEATDLIQTSDTPGTLGWIDRGDGTWQVSLDGWPLYYFSGDANPGDVNGDGSTGFGARWYVMAYAAPEAPAAEAPAPAPIAQPPAPAPVAQPPATNPLAATPDQNANTNPPTAPSYPSDMGGLPYPPDNGLLPPPPGIGQIPPGIPAGFLPTISLVAPLNGTVALNWIATPNAQMYRIYDTLSSQPLNMAVAQTVNQAPGMLMSDALLAGLTPGESYNIQVRAVDAFGNESPAPAANNSVLTPGLPGATGIPGPANLTVASTAAGSATLSWMGIPNARGYLILQATNPNGPFNPSNLGQIPGTTATVTGLMANTPYYFQVVALDPFGAQSAPSNVAAYSAPTTMGANTTLSIGSVSPTTAMLSWTPVSSAASYQILASTSPNGPFTPAVAANGASTSVTVGGLTPSSNYFFEVTAIDAIGNTIATSAPTMTVTTSSSSPVTSLSVAAPGSLIVKSTTGSTATLSWMPSQGATSYAVLQSNNGAGQFALSNTATISGNTATINGLQPNTTYFFQVVAIDPQGHQSVASNMATGLTTSALAGP